MALTETAGRGLRVQPASLERQPPQAGRRWALRVEFVGARQDIQPEGIQPTQALVNYLRGPRQQRKTALPTYGGVRYRDVWPGIDVIWEGIEGRLKSSFVVRPGTDPSKIRLLWRGARTVQVTPQGDLEIQTPLGNFAEKQPVAWQETHGRKVKVRVDYLLRGCEYGFRLGAYDRTHELVVDPLVML